MDFAPRFSIVFLCDESLSLRTSSHFIIPFSRNGHVSRLFLIILRCMFWLSFFELIKRRMENICVLLQDLILRVRQLESHVTQLRNIVLKGQHIKGCKVKAQRSFDFSKYAARI